MADVVRLIHQALSRCDDGDYEGALDLLDRAIKADPTNPQAHNERATMLGHLKRDRESVTAYEQALTLDPVFPGARPWLARTLARLGEHRRAGEEWLRHLRDHPDGSLGMGVCPEEWADCAEQFALAGESARAIEVLEEYLDGYAGRVTTYADSETAPLRLLARLYEKSGNAGRAGQLRELARASPHRVPADGSVPEAEPVAAPAGHAGDGIARSDAHGVAGAEGRTCELVWLVPRWRGGRPVVVESGTGSSERRLTARSAEEVIAHVRRVGREVGEEFGAYPAVSLEGLGVPDLNATAVGDRWHFCHVAENWDMYLSVGDGSEAGTFRAIHSDYDTIEDGFADIPCAELVPAAAGEAVIREWFLHKRLSDAIRWCRV